MLKWFRGEEEATVVGYEPKAKQILKAADEAVRLSKELAYNAKKEMDKIGSLTMYFKDAQFEINKNSKPEEIKKLYQKHRKCVEKLLKYGSK